jgi:hypothetical protein
MAQRASLTLERWLRFSHDQRILTIANELHRASKLMEPDDRERRSNAYERVLALTDLTIQAPSRPAVRRELLRWRDLVAALYVQPNADATAHSALWTCLLRFTLEASRQLSAR